MFKSAYTAAKSALRNRASQAAGVLAVTVGSAQAAVPAEVSAAMTSINDTATGILALVWPIAIAVTVGYVGIKHFKKGANRV